MLSWYEGKLLLEDASALTNDVLHVGVGSLLWIPDHNIMRASKI